MCNMSAKDTTVAGSTTAGTSKKEDRCSRVLERPIAEQSYLTALSQTEHSAHCMAKPTFVFLELSEILSLGSSVYSCFYPQLWIQSVAWLERACHWRRAFRVCHFQLSFFASCLWLSFLLLPPTCRLPCSLPWWTPSSPPRKLFLLLSHLNQNALSQQQKVAETVTTGILDAVLDLKTCS